MSSAIVVGGGIIGCLAALELIARNWQVEILEASARDDTGACSFAAGGMLSPVSELDHGDPLVFEYGSDAIARWRSILSGVGAADLLGEVGSLYCAHPAEAGLLDRVAGRIHARYPDSSLTYVDALELDKFCSGLGERFGGAISFPEEAFVDSQAVISHLRSHLESRGCLRFGHAVGAIESGRVRINDEWKDADLIIDSRGMGARSDFLGLRGVRGEALLVYAPEVKLSKILRVLHPRTPLYLVPRSGSRYYVGATSVESENRGPMRLRSALELMSALYTVHSGFKEAEILQFYVGVRPAFESNFPGFTSRPGLIQLNGFYRHGYLLGPAICQIVLDAYLHQRPLGTLQACQISEDVS